MTVKEMAETYYPRLWDAARLEALVAAGRLSREDADEIISGNKAEHGKEQILC